jgi:hypothetical protein
MWSLVAALVVFFERSIKRLKLFPTSSMFVAAVPNEPIRKIFAHLIRINWPMAILVVISPEIAVKIDLQLALLKLGD